VIRRHVAWLAAVVAACSHGSPSPLAGHRILIESRDTLSEALAQALARKGFTVRRRVGGGDPPTAALVTFTYPGQSPGSTSWLAARLADTRSGVVLAAVSVPLEGPDSTSQARAEQLADSLAARLSAP
jgi:hypothetical protein